MEQGAEDAPVVYLHEIKRQYTQGEATLTILDGAKLALWAGQSVALVAPSGAGKSTLLHIAGLLETPRRRRGLCRRRADLAIVRHRANPDPPHRYRLRLPVAPAAAGIHRAGKRHAAADDPRPEAQRRPSSAPPKSWPISASASASPIGRRNCPAASSSGWRSRARSPTRRGCCSRTSRPAISIPIPRIMSSRR